MIFTAASDHTSPGVNHSLNISDIYGVPIIWGKRCNWTRHAPPLSLHTPSARGLDEALRLPRNPLALPPLCFPILPRALTHVHALSHLQPHADSNKSYTHKKKHQPHTFKNRSLRNKPDIQEANLIAEQRTILYLTKAYIITDSWYM